MGMTQDIERYRAAGLAAEYHRWDRVTFLHGMSKMLEALKADPTLEPRAAFGLTDKGLLTLWHYTVSTGKAATEGDDGGFNLSFPCPPLCPPG